MLKFSTKTNYRIVYNVQRVVLFSMRLFRRNTSNIRVVRRGLRWQLNLHEVIDFLIFFTGGFDNTGVRAFTRQIKSNDVIIDVGGNVGSFCLPVSKQLEGSGKLFVIEPSSYASQKLRTNIAINDVVLRDRIQVIQAFASSHQKAPLPEGIHASWDITASQKHQHHCGVLTSTEGAITITLDSLVQRFDLKRVDWIKIDVDGYEHDVLAGAQELIRTFRPNIFLELCEYSLNEHDKSVRCVIEGLSAMGYQFVGMNGKHFGKDIQKIEDSIPKMGTINIFAKPIETQS